MQRSLALILLTLTLVTSLAVAATAAAPARAGGALTDLQTAVDNPTDGADGSITIVRTRHRTVVVFRVAGLDPAAAGERLGAHLHVGPCLEGDGAAAGPHFNIDAYDGDPSPEVSRSTEVWLDFDVRQSGRAHAVANVPFVLPPGGSQSVVIHALPTDPSGAAGARQACLEVTA